MLKIKMHNPLISVIVPVYNSEQYLSRCVESILNQSYSNLEIILVDDGSQDNCGSMCDTFAKNDRRIKVIHRKNGGSSDARNAGLDIATGKYLAFVDSDDFIHKNFVKRLFEICEENHCEIAQCSFEHGKKNNFSSSVNTKTTVQVSTFDHIRIFRGRKLKIAAWGKLYKSILFSNIRFPLRKIHEDEFVTYKVVYAANRVAILKDKLYYYYQSENSIMRKQRTEVRLDFIEAYTERIAFFQNLRETELETLSKKELAVRAMLYNIKNKNTYNSKEVSDKLLRICRNNSKGLLFNRRIALYERILLNAFLLLPDFNARLLGKLR